MEKKAINYSPRDLIIINGEGDNESQATKNDNQTNR